MYTHVYINVYKFLWYYSRLFRIINYSTRNKLKIYVRWRDFWMNVYKNTLYLHFVNDSRCENNDKNCPTTTTEQLASTSKCLLYSLDLRARPFDLQPFLFSDYCRNSYFISLLHHCEQLSYPENVFKRNTNIFLIRIW